VADLVHGAALAAIVVGEVRQGDELKDKEWAARFEVSRTPVREAFKRLESHGLVDVAAARFTRVRTFTADEAHEAAMDWALLHQGVVRSACRRPDAELVGWLRRAVGAGQGVERSVARAGQFAFFEVLREATSRFGLRLGATAAAYQFRLAADSLPDRPAEDSALQADVLDAVERSDPAAADSAFARWLATRTEPLTLV
jgi:DNA-binding GntR family transcriptional regulator